MAEFHKPVLLKEAIEYLQVKPGEWYVDATVGGGGHSLEILRLDGKVLGIDCDPEAIKAAEKRFSTACPSASWQLARENFAHLKKVAGKFDINQVGGIIFDLGVSSYQLGIAERGFSFNLRGPLDMRMDPRLKITAGDLINGLNKGELAELFFKLGNEKYSRKLADAICKERRIKPIENSEELVKIICQVVGKSGKIHPATRSFLALRLAVNDELNNLKTGLAQAIDLIKKGGRIVVISFHSGEDRIVKLFFKKKAIENKLMIVTKKPITPGLTEIKSNPRSRSSKMRVAQIL